MMSAPAGAQREASAALAFSSQLRDWMFMAPHPILPAAWSVLPKMPLAALLDGAALTTPRGP